jgi:tryptophanyl-tRNA synthetase
MSRVLSGMRPTGKLHLGHLHGVLKNWLKLQKNYQCFFFVADWHALTTEYENTSIISQNVFDMVVDWLAIGIDPEKATIFVQSDVPEHAELHLLLSMTTPLSWLERVPSYKDQQLKLKNKDLTTYGFLGYPLLQSADILIYKAGLVPIGEDQVAHVELTREVARRFNHIYGRNADFDKQVQNTLNKMGKKSKKLFIKFSNNYKEQGSNEVLKQAQELLNQQQNINSNEKELLSNYLNGSSKTILIEPQPLLTKASKMPGLDGQKMSKSYGNTISLRDSLEDVSKKLRKMPTDTQRVRLTDAGDPNKCPVWQLHQVYSNNDTQAWVQKSCKNAEIGCLECKQPIIDAVLEELKPIQERIKHYERNPNKVYEILANGCNVAKKVASETMNDVRQIMCIKR